LNKPLKNGQLLLRSSLVPITTSSTGQRRQSMKNIIKNQNGQGIMEYVIISSLIGIICLATVKSFGTVIKTRVEWMEKDVVNTIKNPATK
jgi:Flp pilus assembly pilin Flp